MTPQFNRLATLFAGLSAIAIGASSLAQQSTSWFKVCAGSGRCPGNVGICAPGTTGAPCVYCSATLFVYTCGFDPFSTCTWWTDYDNGTSCGAELLGMCSPAGNCIDPILTGAICGRPNCF